MKKGDVVSKYDWKTLPMGTGYLIEMLNRKLTAEEYGALVKGLIPKEMEDKWFVYKEENWLYLHRSWTGFCIFQVEVVANEGNYALTELRINSNEEEFNILDSSSAVDLFFKVIDSVIRINSVE